MARRRRRRDRAEQQRPLPEGQLADLDFVLTHVDDVESSYIYDGAEIVEAR
jgi:hypothetical protein